jgi:dihydroxy-acid dehydratase
VPLLADLKPGVVSLPEFHRAGGVPAVLRELDDLIEDAPAVLASSIGEIARAAPEPDGVVVHTRADPVAEGGGLVVLRGSLAPRGALVKAAGVAPEFHRSAGPARVFECEEDACVAIYGSSVAPGDVVVIRHEGPKGGPGMREMLGVTAAIVGAGLGESVALVTAEASRAQRMD